MTMFLRRTCREASLLLTSRLDRQLPLADRIALRLHLAVCKACPVFDRQVKLMSRAMGKWRAYAERDADH
ncbi:zf-HC2 domain-containing protein [Methylibium sp.]|uniref:zf-HC2 domain-containing protein n=1 Tax=Methylibium sp. TaxID=2067992 RepID=UPI003D09E5F9